MTQPDFSQTLSAKEVAQYLRDNEEFFVEYPELTAELIIPHQQRGTVSLVELKRSNSVNSYMHSVKNLQL